MLQHVTDLTAVALNEGYEKILPFRVVKYTTCVNELLFVIDLCVGRMKTAPGLAADGILQTV